MALRLKINPKITYSGLLDFDGGVYPATTNSSAYSILQGNKKAEFKLWLDTSILTTNNGILSFVVADSSDYLAIRGSDSTIEFLCNSNPSGFFDENSAYINIDNSFVNKILQFEIGKTVGEFTGDGSILYVKVNGENKPLIKKSSGSSFGSSQARIGYVNSIFDKGTIWDVKVTDSDTGVLEHYWKGYPNGNTNTAWEDTGNDAELFNLSLQGTGPHDTRSVTGFSGGSVSSLKNKVNISSTTTIGGVADFDSNGVVTISSISNDDFKEGILKWNMWLDNNSGYNNKVFVFDTSTNGTYGIQMNLKDSSIWISHRSGYYTHYNILNYDNQVLDCELKWDDYASTSNLYVQYFKINGITQSGVQSGFISSTIPNEVLIGSAGDFGSPSQSFLDNATVWDFQFETPLEVLLHDWKGYPEGNTLGAWEDNTGNLNAENNTVSTTRSINDKITNIFTATNKLILKLPDQIINTGFENDFTQIFIDGSNVWIGTSDSSILKTTTSFESYNVYDASSSGSNNRVIDLYFYDQNNGYRLIEGLSGPSWGVAYTTDGGETWIQTQNLNSYQYYDTHTFSDNSTYLVGDSWNYESDDLMHSVTINTSYFGSTRGISFKDDTVGYRVETDGSILRSSDGGSSWTRESGFNTFFNDVAAYQSPSSDIAVAVGTGGRIAQRAGGTWNSVYTDSGFNWEVVEWKDSNTVYVGGWSSSTGRVLKSSDSGANWVLHNNYDNSINDVKINGNKLYIVGNKGFLSSENI